VLDLGRKVIAVVHLPALPGAPRYRPPFEATLDRVRDEARLLAQAGADALLVENFGDVPFEKGGVSPHTVAAMTAAVLAVREVVATPVGVNVLRNDAAAAIGIAAVTGASFVRVNVHVGVRVTDQGVIEGAADRSLRLRAHLGTKVAILADVDVKHSAPLAPRPLEEEAEDAVTRGLADAIVVTGSQTGAPVDLAAVRALRARLSVPIVAGSGVTPATVQGVLAAADAVIVGSTLREGGRAGAPLDPDRVRAFLAAAKEVR
jgi:membrane complex biogenesis BtpA family protein